MRVAVFEFKTFSRPQHVAEPAPVAQIHAKKPRLETFSVSGSVALKVCVKPWHDEDRRGAALFQLQSIVVAWPEGFGIVRLCSLDSQELDLDELSYSIASACSHKATGTIVRRLASLTHFVQWASHTNLCSFPVSERVAWSYLAHLDKTEAAWSKPSGFTQSVNWCRGVLDLYVEDDFLSSPRVAGICKGFQARAPPPKRAPALSFAEVRFIEVLAASGQNCQDVVCAGAVLFMLFACARASDAAQTVSVCIDWSDPTGTTVYQSRKARLPWACGAACSCPCWRRASGLRRRGSRTGSRPGRTWALAIQERSPSGALCLPLMRLANPPGSPWRRKAWLRAVLAAEFPESRRLSSHSLKATGLSWAASAGVRWKLAGCLPITCATVPAAQRHTAETFSLPRPGSLRKCCWP